MDDKLVKELIDKIDSLKSEMKSGFQSVNKRLDGIEYELKKIDTVLSYTEQYKNIPA